MNQIAVVAVALGAFGVALIALVWWVLRLINDLSASNARNQALAARNADYAKQERDDRIAVEMSYAQLRQAHEHLIAASVESLSGAELVRAAGGDPGPVPGAGMRLVDPWAGEPASAESVPEPR